MRLSEMQREAYKNSYAHGFWETGQGIETLACKLALVHSEVSEALECLRTGELGLVTKWDGKPEGFPSELADIVIRVGDLAEALGIDLGAVVEAKMLYNAGRPPKHGKVF